jgi:tetratricopeptide (TPR) repeat protein
MWRAIRPLARPGRSQPDEPPWDGLVVVDSHASIAIWQEQVAGFVTGLRRCGVFRRVRVRRLDTDDTDPAGVLLRGPDGDGPPRVPAGVPAGARQRIVFVVTDGAAPAWRAGAAQPVLHGWALRRPVAVLHLLPPQQWHRTGVAPHRLWLRAPGAGAANARLRWRPRDPLPADPPEHAVPVPVLESRPRWLAAWANLLADGRSRWIGLPALFAGPELHPAAAAVADPGDVPAPHQRVREFISQATPTALVLAGYLAAVPLHPAVIRLIRRELLPESETSHLAEVLNSGLVQPSTGELSLEFPPEVREELLAVGRRRDTARVWRAVAARLGATVPGVAWLGRVLDDPDAVPLPEPDPALVPYLRVERAVLRALSGKYLARARRLDEYLFRFASGTTEATPLSVTMTPPKTAEPHVHSGGIGVSIPTPAETATVTPTAPARPPVRTPAIWGNIPPRNPNFTGRTKLLTQLHEQIQSGTTAVLPHALHGMGGVGKSHLAIQYVYLHQDEFNLIWWIPAERSAQIGAAMVELAQRMGLAAGPDVGSARAAVLEALRLGQPFDRWLLIFDNAESPEALRPYLPTGGPGSIMITSRNPLWSSIASTLEVDVFTREESIQLLRRRGPDLDHNDANRLADALGDLPLALEQAAAWRAETGMSADEYLRLFNETEQRIELLAQTTPMDYQLPVAAAWNVSLDRLVISNPAAFRLLQLCSFLAPEPIPRTLLGSAYNVDVHPELNAALRDPMRLNRAIRDISRYALARINHRTNSIQMHRLVQAVLKDRMTPSEQEAMRSSAHLLLAAGDRNDPDTPANWPSYAELYPHVDASGAVDSTEPRVQQLVDNEAKFLYWSGDYEVALELSRRAYESWRERLGEDAPSVLSIGHRLGFVLYVLGRYREAAEHNRQILATYERTRTEDTEELLRQIGAVAADLRVAGEWAEALRVDEDLYQRHLRLLGSDDPNTLNAAHNMAVSLRLNGQIGRAYEVDQETYDHRVLLFGEDHVHTLESHMNLVLDRRELGEYLAARNEMQHIVDRLPQIWGGTERTQGLRARRRLASAIRKAGDHERARSLSEEIRAAYAGQYGEDHPDALLAELGLVIDLRATGHPEQAVELGERLHNRYRRLLHDEHPYTVAASLNNAISYRLRGDVVLARTTNERGLTTLTERLGADHPLVLAGSVNLANDLYTQGDYAAAHARDADTVERLQRLFGNDHPTTLIAQGNLVQDLLKLNRQTEAFELHAHVAAGLQQRLGPDHPATLAGTDLEKRGDCDLDPMPL